MRTLLALPLLALATAASAQKSDFDWSKSLSVGTVVSVHNINGNITFLPGTGSRVEVSGSRHGRGRNTNDVYVAVKEYSGSVVVCVLMKDTGESCDEDGAHMRSRNGHWNDDAQMDVTVHLPSSMRARANSVSGDISISGAQGDVHANSVSGEIRMDDLHASSVRAGSVSGNVKVSISVLTGNGDLEFKSVSGDVLLTVPKSLDAEFSMSTVSGDLQTDFPITVSGRMARRSIHARIGKGGRNIDISTVSGDVRLRAG